MIDTQGDWQGEPKAENRRQELSESKRRKGKAKSLSRGVTTRLPLEPMIDS